MPLGPRRDHPLRAVVFDLDEALLARARAWQYAVEESVASVCGRRVQVEPLAQEYRLRPWGHVLSILVTRQDELARCEALCREVFARSAMKRLLVHEGMGMALDHLRAEGLEMGAVSHEPHATALKQIQSTGLDRFLTVLSATPEGERWDPCTRAADCVRFLGCEASRCAFVSPAEDDLGATAKAGFLACAAGWAATEADGFWRLETPAALSTLCGSARPGG